jgi:hypothetical protein
LEERSERNIFAVSLQVKLSITLANIAEIGNESSEEVAKTGNFRKRPEKNLRFDVAGAAETGETVTFLQATKRSNGLVYTLEMDVAGRR